MLRRLNNPVSESVRAWVSVRAIARSKPMCSPARCATRVRSVTASVGGGSKSSPPTCMTPIERPATDNGIHAAAQEPHGPVAQERAGVDVLAALEDADLAGVRGRALDGGGDRAAVLGGSVREHATEVGAARVGDEQLGRSLARHVAQG